MLRTAEWCSPLLLYAAVMFKLPHHKHIFTFPKHFVVDVNIRCNTLPVSAYSKCLSFYSLLVTSCTTSLTLNLLKWRIWRAPKNASRWQMGFNSAFKGLKFNNCTLCPHCIYLCCIFLRTNSDCATYSINWLVFITEMKSVYSAVRTGSLNKAVCASSLKG